MPLNDAQKSLVALTLEDYLEEFLEQSHTAAEFSSFIQQIKSGIDDSGEKELDDNTIYNCLRTPDSYFLRLNDNNADAATVKDVKRQVLILLDPYLQKKATSLNVDISSTWNLNAAINAIPESLANQALKLAPPRTESDESGVTKEVLGEIFSFMICQEDAPSQYLIAVVKTHLPDRDVVTKVRLVEVEHAFPEWEDDDNFIQEHTPLAREKAIMTATEHAVSNLQDKSLISFAEASVFAPKKKRGNSEPQITVAQHTLQLFLHPYYYARICDGSILVSMILGFTKSRANTLLSAPVLSLLETNSLPASCISKLCRLTSAQRKLLNTHYQSIANHSFPLELLLSLNEGQCSLFADETIIGLLKGRKISHQVVSTLQHYHLAVIKHFHNMINQSSEEMAWNALSRLNARTCECLMSDDMRHFIRSEKMSINDIFVRLEEKLSRVFGARLARAHLAGKGSYTALCQLKEAEVTGDRYMCLVNRHAYLDAWLEAGYCTLDDIAASESALMKTTLTIYASKLLRSQKAKIAQPSLPACDLTKLQNELRVIAAQHDMPENNLVEQVTRSFLILLKEEMVKHVAYKYNEQLRMFCNECIAYINHAEAGDNNAWQKALESIIHLSTQRLNAKPTINNNSKNTLTRVSRLFNGNKSIRDMSSVSCSVFCRSLQQFSVLLPETASPQFRIK